MYCLLVVKIAVSSNRLPTVTSPYDDGIPGNPVGSLQELCISHRWEPPSYLLDGENGLPHEREFVITCIVETYQEIGLGKSKKLAKRQAAYRMMMKLKDTPIEMPNQGAMLEDEDEVRLSHQVNQFVYLFLFLFLFTCRLLKGVRLDTAD
jgi:hypothetical protein